MTRIDHVVGDVHRISTWNREVGITFNQFLIADERPALIHTGIYGDYEQVRKAVSEVMDPGRLALGKHRLRFLETPHVHHWDSMMLFDETTRSLFPSDLFIQPGDQPPVVTENLGTEMCSLYRATGIFAHEAPVRRVVDRIEALAPRWAHAMHGGTLSGDALPSYVRALREQPFAYEGKLLGRELGHETGAVGGLP